MNVTTHKPGYRLLAGMLSLICLFSLVMGNMPKAFAAGDELPLNVSLTFSDHDSLGNKVDYITLDLGGKKATHKFAQGVKFVYPRADLQISLNGEVEEGRYRIEIPYLPFKERDGKLRGMNDEQQRIFKGQISSDQSQLKLVSEDKEKGIYVLENKKSSSLQLSLSMIYYLYCYNTVDGSEQPLKVTITDTVTGTDYSPEPITAVFQSDVTGATVRKSADDKGVINGCYYKWDDSLEDKFLITSKLGIDEAKFNELCKDYYFVSYRIDTSLVSTQPCYLYIDEQPINGTAISIASQDTAGHEMFEKETSGPYARRWKRYCRDSGSRYFLALVQYDKHASYDKDSSTNEPVLVNRISVTYVGIDGDADDVKGDMFECRTIWQGAGAIYHGDIWSVKKSGYEDPSGGLELLKKGKDVTFAYKITGIGHTYKYGALDNYTYSNGPYKLELVDDLLYVNGLGEKGEDIARLDETDFHFKTFSLKVKHNVVEDVNLDMSVKKQHAMPFKEREPVEVYVMSADKPGVWQLDQYVTKPYAPYTDLNEQRYVNDDKSLTFNFKHDNVYRIKFVYNKANGDIELESLVTGVLKGTGNTVKKVLSNMEKIHLANFQLFNWDAQMGYDGKGVWENPTDGVADGAAIFTSNPGMREDLFAFDAANYEGHSNEPGNIAIARRLPKSNNLVDMRYFSGAAKQGTTTVLDKLSGRYTLAAVNGLANSEEDIKSMVETGLLDDSREIVFYDLLPSGTVLKKDSVTVAKQKNLGSSSYNWERVVGSDSSLITAVNTEAPEIDITTINNYKGTLRQMAIIKLKYKDLPILKVGMEDNQRLYAKDNARYTLGAAVDIQVEGQVFDMRTNELSNDMEAQFIDNKGNPVELKGTMTFPDDGTAIEGVLDRKGQNAFSDVNNDGETTKKTIVSARVSNTADKVYSHTQLFKWIKEDELDDSFRFFTQTYAGHNYTYKIQFVCGNGRAKNVVLFDSIEQAFDQPEYQGKPYWLGMLTGVDLQEAKDAGFDKIKVYVNTSKYYTGKEYMTDRPDYEGLQPEDLTAANGWQQIDPDTYKDWSKVRTIAFSIGKDVVFGEDDNLPKSISVYLKMRAPDTISPMQTPTEQVLAYNEPYYYSEKQSIGAGAWDKDTTKANTVTIGLKSATLEIPAITKTYSGSELPADFEETCTFNIEPIGTAPAPKAYKNGTWGDVIKSVDVKVGAGNTSAVSNENGAILFTEPGTYEYEITEKAGSKSGVTYSKAKYKLTAEVTDDRKEIQYDTNTLLKVNKTLVRTHDNDGSLLSAPVKVTGMTFVNSYSVVPVEFEIPAVTKKITGAARPQEKEFSFRIGGLEEFSTASPPVPEKLVATVTGEGTASFGKATFTQAGNYYYIIQEMGAGATGYTYDNRAFYVLISVVDDNAKLKVSQVSYASAPAGTMIMTPAEKVEFVNTYNPNPSNTVTFPEVSKVYTGQARPSDKSFSFTLAAVTNGAPMPDKDTVTVTGVGKAAFGETTYTKAGVYSYTITENDLDNDKTGYTKDSTVYTFTVTVTDDNGTLKAQSALTKGGSEASAAVFTNNYAPQPVSIVPPIAVKQINGDERPAEKAFVFELTTEQKDAPLPDKTDATVTGEGNATAFGEIKFDTAGVYVYKIAEKDLDKSYVSYTKDNTVYTYTVTVTDNNGKLEAAGELTKDGASADKLLFVNKYQPAPVNADLEVSKQYTGQTRPSDKSFNFTLAAVTDGAPMPENATVTVTGEGKAAFGEIRYTKAGVYEYTLTEDDLDDDKTGYGKDSTVYTYTVTVTDESGKLKAQGVLTKDGKEADAAVFINNYTPEPASIVPPVAVKQIQGDERPVEKEFVFELTTEDENAPMPEVTEAKVTGEGEASAFGEITFETAGVYVYKITEKDLDDSYAGYTKDDAAYTYTVTVTDNNGKLEAVGELTKDEEAAEKLLFVNKYETTPVDTELELEKKITGKAPQQDETYTFELKAEGEAPLPEITKLEIKGAGKGKFGKWTYTKAGTYTYKITETKGGNAYCEYSKTVYTITDTVTDTDSVLGVSRKITADDKDAEKVVFVNNYTEPVKEDVQSKDNDNTAPQTGNTGSMNSVFGAVVILAAALCLNRIKRSDSEEADKE